MTIFFFTDIPWEGLYQRPHHIAKRLSNLYTVIWIEPITLSKKPNLKIKKIDNNLFTLNLPAFPYNAKQLSIKKISFFLSECKITRKILLKIQSYLLNKVFHQLNINKDDYIFLFENFHFYPLKKFFNPRITIFDYIDNAFGFTKLPQHVIEDWQNSIINSDFVITTSKYLFKQINQLRNNDVYIITNGVEFEHFTKNTNIYIPTDLPKSGKIVGYVGAVYPWLDFKLIELICAKIPDVNLIFIGKSHPSVTNILNNLMNYTNFKFLGYKNYEKIPSYLIYFDAAIIPFKRNKLTEGVNPVKMFEYAAAGLPIVCTEFSDDLYDYKNFISICKTNEEFIQNLKSALTRKDDADFTLPLKTFAQNNDWNLKFIELHKLLEKYLQKN